MISLIDVRAVVVAGVDVGDAQLDGLAQHGDGCVAVRGRAEHARAGQLHGAVAHAGDGQVVGERERSAGDVSEFRCAHCRSQARRVTGSSSKVYLMLTSLT